MNCVTSIKKQKIIRCATTPTSFRTKLLYAFADDFTASPMPPVITATMTNEEAGAAVGNFTPSAVGKGFSSIEVFLDKPLEEMFKKDGNSTDSKLKCFIQNNVAGKGFLRKCEHGYMIFAAELSDGDFVLLGDIKTPAMIGDYEGKNGKENSIELTLQGGPGIPLVWTGAPPMEV